MTSYGADEVPGTIPPSLAFMQATETYAETETETGRSDYYHNIDIEKRNWPKSPGFEGYAGRMKESKLTSLSAFSLVNLPSGPQDRGF